MARLENINFFLLLFLSTKKYKQLIALQVSDQYTY